MIPSLGSLFKYTYIFFIVTIGLKTLPMKRRSKGAKIVEKPKYKTPLYHIIQEPLKNFFNHTNLFLPCLKGHSPLENFNKCKTDKKKNTTNSLPCIHL